MAVYNASLKGDLPFLIVILAGGEGRRIGGGKPHRLLVGRPLIQHVIDRVDPDALCGDAQDLALYGLPVFPDGLPGLGPLAGVAAAMRAAEAVGRRAVLTVPCDTPFVPLDLAQRFARAGAPALARSGGKDHPSVALWPITWLPAVEAELAGPGKRALRPFFKDAPRIEWPDGTFDNINTTDDLAGAEARLARP
jgi:molybdopterin-guanine dinucleotide biosynthesis protein A